MKYRHKKLGRIVEPIFNGYKRVTDQKVYYYEKELIEESNDRELIEEKDWIDNIVQEICDTDYKVKILSDKIYYTINKHLPKISEEELRKILYTNDVCLEWEYNKIIELLKSKGLLAE